jgi:dolichol-phosphate mannosyltransferase
LQDVPEAIPTFLAKHAEGFDVVYAIRRQRKEGLLKRACYAAFYRIISRMSEIELPRDAGDFSLLSRRVVDEIRRSPERHRYLRGLRSWVGFRQVGVEVNRDARSAGDSKYSARKLLKLAFDGIFSFSVLPLRVATMVGALVVLGSAAFAAYATFVHLFFSRSPQGFTALIVAVVFLAGVQLLFLGLCGEYIGRIYEQVKQRPQYVLDRIVTAETRLSNGRGVPVDARAPSQAAEAKTLAVG